MNRGGNNVNERREDYCELRGKYYGRGMNMLNRRREDY